MTQTLIDDVYVPYETGLHNLRRQLGENHPRYADVLAFHQQLSNNITQSRLYGDTKGRRAEFAQIVDQINALALTELHISFNDLSGIPTPQVQPTRTLLSEAEERLRLMVSDPGLRASLTAIRYAVEYIWDTNAPRLVEDGTVQGVEHSKRLVEYAVQLLGANGGRPLSPQETYLFMAGIYLHGIGLQCDISTWTEIRERAEQLGAQFDQSFPRQRTASYSIEQQKAIHKNYSYLSAAWIDYASRTGETNLGPAAMTIPRYMIDDLMDVCLHYAHLPINDCPLTFKFNPNGRKQLVTALLRFVHELDVQSYRTTFTRVATYSHDPRQNVSWWLHNRAHISFLARNVVRVSVSVHPSDAEAYGTLIYRAYITEFQSRNAPVLSILAKNGIPIIIDTDLGLEINDEEALLPPKVIHALQAIEKGQGPLFDLADEVRTWLRAIRYEVSEPIRLDDRTVDMRATIDLGSVRQCVLVRCIEGQVKPADASALDAILTRCVPQGWLISDRRVSDLVRRGEEQTSGIEIFNLTEFLQQKVWGPYFDALAALVEKDTIPRLSVDLSCSVYNPEGAASSPVTPSEDRLSEYIDQWLCERGPAHITILGDSGAGKTWFCRHYAYRQLKCYLKNPVTERLPLLITLHDVARTMSAQQLINEALLERYRLQFVGSAYEVFEEMNRRGKLLLILDGFDEMAQHTSRKAAADTFWELAGLMQENGKVILTSKSDYFSWIRETEPLPERSPHNLHINSLAEPRFQMVQCEPFNQEQVHQALTKRLGTDHGAVVADRILQTPALAAMACKPVMIDLLLTALGVVESDMLTNPARVYLYATNMMLNNPDPCPTARVADKLFFLCELAWEIIHTGHLRIHYHKMPERIVARTTRCLVGNYPLDAWDHAWNPSLLRRSADGFYEFAHQGLADYFVALKIAAESGCLAPNYLAVYSKAGDIPCVSPYEQRCGDNLLKSVETLLHTSGRHWLVSGVYQFLPDMLTEEAATILQQYATERAIAPSVTSPNPASPPPPDYS